MGSGQATSSATTGTCATDRRGQGQAVLHRLPRPSAGSAPDAYKHFDARETAGPRSSSTPARRAMDRGVRTDEPGGGRSDELGRPCRRRRAGPGRRRRPASPGAGFPSGPVGWRSRSTGRSTSSADPGGRVYNPLSRMRGEIELAPCARHRATRAPELAVSAARARRGLVRACGRSLRAALRETKSILESGGSSNRPARDRAIPGRPGRCCARSPAGRGGRGDCEGLVLGGRERPRDRAGPRPTHPERPRRHRQGPLHRHVRVEDLHLLGGYIPAMRSGRRSSGTSSWARSSRSDPEVTKHQVGDRVVVVLVHRLRELLVLRQRPVVAVRQHQHQSRHHPGPVGFRSGGHLRLLPRHGRVHGQPRRVRPGPVRRPRRLRRSRGGRRPLGPVRLRRRPDRLDGPLPRQDQTGRRRCGVGHRRGRSNSYSRGDAARRRAGDRDRPHPRASGHDRDPHRRQPPRLQQHRRRYKELRKHTGGRGPDVCIEAVGHGGAHLRPGVPLRQGQAAAAPGERPAPRDPRGDHGLPQGRRRCSPSGCSPGWSTSSRSGR